MTTKSQKVTNHSDLKANRYSLFRSTRVQNLFKKYNKQFPQFTKDFLREAYYKSILYYLKYH